MSSRLLPQSRGYVAASSASSKRLTTRARHSEATAHPGLFPSSDRVEERADEQELIPTGTMIDRRSRRRTPAQPTARQAH
jgi:hypothetical protein